MHAPSTSECCSAASPAARAGKQPHQRLTACQFTPGFSGRPVLKSGGAAFAACCCSGAVVCLVCSSLPASFAARFLGTFAAPPDAAALVDALPLACTPALLRVAVALLMPASGVSDAGCLKVRRESRGGRTACSISMCERATAQVRCIYSHQAVGARRCVQGARCIAMDSWKQQE